MLSFKELQGTHLITEIPINIQQNMQELLQRMNVVRTCFAAPMVVTSGYRDMKDQMRINPKAPQSQHMQGNAVDISDPDGALKAWIKLNMDVMEVCGLYLEDFGSTPTWVHFQQRPSKSGHRIFLP